ncbi:MAG: PaaI family thioesterase [Burkholderiales bacterium]
MDRDTFFWQIADGRLPPPRCAQTLGMKIVKVDAEAGVVEAEFNGKPEFTNPVGNVQGGFLAAMLDDSMGIALACQLGAGEFSPTLNLNISFLKPAKPGTLCGVGRVVRRGKDVCYLAGELFQNGDLVATATATALVRKI